METLNFLFNLDVAMNNGFSQPMRVLNSEFSKIQSASDKLQRSLGDVNSYQRMSQSVKTSASRLEYLQACYRTSSQSVENARQRTATLAVQYEAAKKRVQQWSQVMPKNSMMLMLAKKREQELSQEYRLSQKETNALIQQRDKLYRQTGEASSRLDSEKRSLQEMGDALKQAGISTDNLGTKQKQLQDALARTQSAQEKLSKIRETLTWGNIKGTVMSGMATFSAIKAPVKLAADFEEAMAKVKAVAFTNEDADLSMFQKLSDQAEQLGADTKFTAIQAAHAQENLLRANMAPKDVLAAMPAVLNMSSAEGMDIDTASSIIAKGLGGMNLEGKYAGRLADILAFTSANSNTNISMIGEAFKTFAPIAKSQNMTMEQAASYIGVLANAGYEGSDSGQALKASYMQLAKLPKEATETFKQLGVQYQTREGKMRELPDMLIAINKSMQERKYGEVKQLEVMETIFGKRAGAPMLAFMSKAVAGEAETMQNGVQNNSFGRAQQMADINLDTLNGQLDILSSAWDGLRTSIGKLFSPLVREGVELLSNALSKLNELIKEFPNASKYVAMAFAGWGVFKTARGLWDIGSALLQLPGAWLEVARAGRAASEVAATTPSLFGRIGSMLVWLKGLVLAHPLLAIGALVAAGVVLAIKHWDKIKAWWNDWVIPNVWEPLKGYASDAADWCSKKWNAAREYLLSLDYAGMWNNVKAHTLSIASWVDDKWNAGREYLLSLDYAGMWNSALNAAMSCIDNLKNLWDNFKNWIVDKFKNLNPFNWEMPSWLKAAGGSSAQQVKNANAALSGNLPGFATGGILTKHSVIQVAEDGPEAIIPLTDKSRGLPLLMTAAQSLGVNIPSMNTPSMSGLSLPSMNTPSMSGLSLPSMNTPSMNAVSFPSMNTPRMSGLSFPSINAPSMNAVSFPSMNTPSMNGLSLPSMNTPSMNGLSLPSMNTPSMSGLSFPSINTPSMSGLSLPSMNTPSMSGLSLPSMNAPSMSAVSFPSINTSSEQTTNRSVNMPPVNITVNVSGQDAGNSQSLAINIADKVREVLNDIMSLEERVAYA